MVHTSRLSYWWLKCGKPKAGGEHKKETGTVLAYRETFGQSKYGFWVRSTYGTTYFEISGIRPAVPEYWPPGPPA